MTIRLTAHWGEYPPGTILDPPQQIEARLCQRNIAVAIQQQQQQLKKKKKAKAKRSKGK